MRSELYLIEDDIDGVGSRVKERKVLYKFHKFRERDKKLVSRKKIQVKKQTGKLSCEVCNFDFEVTYGDLG